ncbi:MAG: M16 family metallopeptidase [Planctomycetota bacterium]
MRFGKLLLALAVPLSILATPLHAEDLDLKATLPVDPAVAKMGRLENGMAYWIRPNQTPPKKVGLLLHIGSGSLDETEGQRGVAHFLEHMAFNGSANFPPGEVVKFFESIGMQFGADQNAMTGFDQTSYILNLPDNEKATLEKGFLFFSDVAFRLSLLEEELDKERGVILEEERARSGASMRMFEKLLPLLAPGSRMSQRIPIGLPEVIKGADRDVFLDYYRTWYRPENSTLVVCGDVEVGVVEELIKKSFSEWEPAEKPAVHADAGIELTKGLRAGVVTDKEVTRARVGVSILRELRPRVTVGDLRAGLVEQIGGFIVNRRLRKMVQEGEAPFQSAQVGSQALMSYCEEVGADASGEPGKTVEMLKAVLVEVRRARVHGFREDEFATAKKAIVSGVERAAARESTVDSMSWLMRLNRSVTQGRKPMSSAQRETLVKALLPGITLEEVEKAFVAMAALDQGLVVATLPEKEGVPIPTEEELLAAYREAVAAEVTKTGEVEEEKGLLAKEPEPGKVAERTEEKDLGVTSAVFANGVVVHVKPTDFRKDSVVVVTRLVGGTIEETAENRGISMAASVALTSGMAASRRHSASDLTDLLTGRKFSFGANAGDATMEVMLRGSPTEMDDGFRLLHLLLTAPKVEGTSLDRWKQSMLQQLDLVEKNVGAQAGLATDGLLTGGDARFRLPSKEQVEAFTPEACQAWLDRILKSAPIEVAISGDIEAERALELARRYLGSLPKRPVHSEAVDKLRVLKVDKGPLLETVEVDTITPQALVRAGWRGAARKMRRDSRVLLFSSQVATARLLKVIREEKGLTYSVQCAYAPASAYDGNASLFAIFTIAPDKAEEGAKLAKEVIQGLLTEPPTEEEMKAVAAQLENIITTQMRQPGFWVRVLSSLRTRGREIEDIRNLVADYTSVTKEEILETLGRYLTEERRFCVIAKQKVAEPPEKPAEKPAKEPVEEGAGK